MSNVSTVMRPHYRPSQSLISVVTLRRASEMCSRNEALKMRALCVILASALWILSATCGSLASTAAPTQDSVRERRHIRVVTIESPPFMMKRRPEEMGAANDTSQWYGYCMDFFLELIRHLPYDVSYELREVTDGRFGSKQRTIVAEQQSASENGSQPAPGRPHRPINSTHFKRVETWNGLVGELEAGRAELALAPMAVMAERELVIDFTVPFYDLVGIQILLKRPEVPQDWFKFLTVLDNDVWLSIGLAYFLTSFIIYFFDRLSPYSHKNLARIERARRQRRQHFRPKSALASAGSGGRWPAAGPLEPATSAFYLSRALVDSSKHEAGELQVKRRGETGGTLSVATAAARGAGAGADLGPAARRRPSQDYLESLRARLGIGSPSMRNAGDLGPQHTGLEARERHQRDDNGDGDDQDDDDDDDDDEHSGKPDFNLRDSLWFCITSLTPQGGGEAPQNLSGRVVAGAWWLFCFIVIASYTANLAAFLTVSRLDIPIESLDDLAKQYRIKYAPIDGSAEQTYFERMAYIEEIFYNIWKEMSLNDSLAESERSKFAVWDYPISDKYTKIWAQIQEAGAPATQELALERVRQSHLDDGFALLADANLVRYAVMTDCSLKAVGDEFSRKPVALGVRKNEERLRDQLSYAILQLINRRFMEVLRERWWTNNPARVACEPNDESEGISIENIGGVFIIILAGIALSFLVWALERFAYKTKVEVSRELLESMRAGSAESRKQPGGG